MKLLDHISELIYSIDVPEILKKGLEGKGLHDIIKVILSKF